jgi:hypothetical protein
MTTTYHSEMYYKVRSVVRWVFWTSVAFLAITGFGKVVKALENEPSKCAVALNRDFTWEATGSVDLAECRHPNNVVLLPGGTWVWEN